MTRWGSNDETGPEARANMTRWDNHDENGPGARTTMTKWDSFEFHEPGESLGANTKVEHFSQFIHNWVSNTHQKSHKQNTDPSITTMTMSKMSLKSMKFSTSNVFNNKEMLPFAEAVRESRRAKGLTSSNDYDMQQHFLVVLTLDDNGNVIDLDAPIVSMMGMTAEK